VSSSYAHWKEKSTLTAIQLKREKNITKYSLTKTNGLW